MTGAASRSLACCHGVHSGDVAAGPVSTAELADALAVTDESATS